LTNVRLGRVRLVCLLVPLFLASPCWSQPAPANEWSHKIIGLLRAHLHLPPGLEVASGEVSVDFTIDRSGFVKSTTLVRSAGIQELDSAVLAAIGAAQPFPVRPGMDDSELKIPVAFGFPPSPASLPSTADEEKLKARLKGICRGC
jgi:TonB family protein